MASLTTIDPSDICLPGGARRVLIVRGDYQPGIDRDDALAKRRQMVICVAGETEIVVSRNALEERFTLSSPIQGIILEQNESFQINSRDAATVVVVIEEDG